MQIGPVTLRGRHVTLEPLDERHTPGLYEAMQDEEVRLTSRAGRLGGLPSRILEVEDLRAGQRHRLLGAYDYQRQLERGYSVTRDPSGAVVRSVVQLAPGTVLTSQVADGTVDSTVTGIFANDTNDTREEST